MARWSALLMVLFCVLFCSSPALAHKMYVFAEADGTTIRGEAYFRGGTPARDVTVTAFDPAGEEIGKTTTDQEGKFTMEAKFRCGHKLVVRTPDGHGAEFTLAADQLPKDLPPRGEIADSTGKPPSEEATVATTPADQPPATIDSRQWESVRDEIARLRNSVNEYRKEIRQYREQTRFRDVIGGIGWILGLAGIAFYFLGLRRK